ncbi:MAG: Holliday junction branch migration protein RuvA [Desulfuromonadales bacterium]|jgi:Holliday junction DNA helicase RuvA|nr:Holliday junction branch migration protein RuvA [Desulfuromonadales bacterium]
MIALVKGDLAYKSVDHVIIDVNGVGYRLFIPLSTYYTLPENGQVQMFVHTHVREDALQLYGFLTVEEKEMFATLIGISGVGPKLAVNVLSHISVVDLETAIAHGDVKRLSSLPGIGKKTAERLVLELKDKLRATGRTGQASVAPANLSGLRLDPLNDVISALINLGYKEAQARKILESMEIAPDTPMEDILKGALKVLVR